MVVSRTLMVRAGADFSQMRRSMMQAQKDLEKFKNGVNKTMRSITTILAATGATLGIRAATREAIHFEAALQQIDRLMGSSAASFNRWVSEQAHLWGMARSEATRYGAIFANLISGFASGADETARYTQDLLQAAAVISSSTGRTMEDVMDRIRSGMLGSTEAIEDLGVNVNISLLEATNAFKQFAGNRSWAQLDFNTQQTIRYFAILEQTATKYGLELVQNTATRQSAFVAQLKNVQLALGQAFLPIYNSVLPALTRMATALANVVNYIAAFMQALFGYNTAKQTQAAENQASAVTDLGEAYEEAGKKAKGAVAGFDELNLVGGTTPSAVGAGAIGGLVPAESDVDTGALDTITGAMDDVSSKAAEMAAKVKSAFGQLRDFIQNNSAAIKAALAGIGAAFVTYFVATNWTSIISGIVSALNVLRTALTTSWTAALGPIGLVVAAIGAAVAAIVYFYETNEAFRGFVDGIFRKIGEAATWLWQNVLVPFGEWIAAAFVQAWDVLSVALRWIYDNILKPVGEFFVWLWKNVFVPVGEVLIDVLGVAFQFVADVAKSFWENVLVPLGKALSEMLGPAIEAVSAVLTFLWEKVLKPFAKFLGDLIKGVLTELVNIFKVLWQNVLKPLAEFIGGTFKMVLDNVFKAIGGIIDGVKKAFIGLMNFITGVFTGDWGKAWNGIKDFFGGIWDGIVALFKGAINIIIDAMNWLIRQLNKVKVDLPGWVEDLTGVGSFGINIPEIPRLARGGLAFGPTLAMVGDNPGARTDPEVIAPLSKLEAIMTSGGNRDVLAALGRVEQAIRDLKYIQAVISRSEIGRAAIDVIRDEQRRTGQLPFRV